MSTLYGVTGISAKKASSQIIPNNILTEITFMFNNTDNMASKFVAPETSFYHITGHIRFGIILESGLIAIVCITNDKEKEIWLIYYRKSSVI